MRRRTGSSVGFQARWRRPGGATTTDPAAASISTPSMRNAAPTLEDLEPLLHDRVDVLGGPMAGAGPVGGRREDFGRLRDPLDLLPVRGFSITPAVSHGQGPGAATFPCGVRADVPLAVVLDRVTRPCGHAGWSNVAISPSIRAAAHQRQGQGGARALAEPQAEVEQRLQAEVVQRDRRAGLGRAVAGDARREPRARRVGGEQAPAAAITPSTTTGDAARRRAER